MTLGLIVVRAMIFAEAQRLPSWFYVPFFVVYILVMGNVAITALWHTKRDFLEQWTHMRHIASVDRK